MAVANKYKANSTYWHIRERRTLTKQEADWYRKNQQPALDILYFASTFELVVYQHLIELFGFTAVIHQYPVDLLPPGRCHPKGKKWIIDFAIKPDKQLKRSLMLVEAKGYPTDTFLTNLSILEATNPNLFKSLFLIFDRNIPAHRIITNLRKTNSYAQGKVLTLPEFVERYSLTVI